MGPLYEPGWQKRSRTKSCGEYQHSAKSSQRRQSAPSIILSKALTKSKPVSRDCVSQVSHDTYALIQSLLTPTRKLISQSNVLLQTGLQTQDRCLILFTDILIITKPKSVMQVKQKACVRVSEMWTASCVDEVCETITDSERSVVMGWPTYNCVATFSTSEEKDRWLSLIESCIKEEKMCDDPKMIPLKIFAKDVGNCAYAKTLLISNTDCTFDVISTALKQFGLSGGIKDYKLWVCSKQDETPYPLIGHEFPYSIKMSHIRLLQQDAVISSYSQMALVPIDAHCQFFLRPSHSQIKNTLTEQKSSRRRMSLISWAFKRGPSIEQAVQSESPAHTITPAPGHLFGRPLSEVIIDNTLPSPIMDMLKCLCNEGAVTRGIFRRSAGAKVCRELRKKLDSGHYREPLSGESVLVIAAVFKDFLRNIPGSLLCEDLYEQWLQAVEQNGERDGLMTERNMVQEVQRLVQLLPKENVLLLRNIIAMLYHIQLSAEHNQMNSFNLAVCIAHSCLWNSNQQSQEKDVKKVCDLVRVLIDNCCVLFGDEIITLLKDLTEDNRSIHGSVGSLQQMSDSGYESLKNEVNTDTEDISKTRPLKDSRSMDSLMSLSDCDLECPENNLPSLNPLAKIRNFTPAVRQPQSLLLHRHSMPAIALISHEQKETSESGKYQEFERPDEVNENTTFLEHNFKQLNFRREKQTSPSSSVSSPVTSPTVSSVSSMDNPFSPQSSPARGQSDWLALNNTDYQHTITSPNEKQCQAHHQKNVAEIEGGLQPKVTKNPPPYQQALQQLNRKLFSQTPTRTPEKTTGQLHKGKGPTHGALGDHQVSPAPQTFRFADQTKPEEEVKPPQSVFYGQSCKLTLHSVKRQNAGSKSSKINGQQLRLKALDLHPSSRKIAGDCLMDTSPLGEGLTDNQDIGRSRRLSCCSSSQWVV